MPFQTLKATIIEKEVDIEILPATRFVFAEQQELSDDDAWNTSIDDSSLNDDGWDNEQQTAPPPSSTWTNAIPKENINVEHKNPTIAMEYMHAAKPEISHPESLFIANMYFDFSVVIENQVKEAEKISPGGPRGHALGVSNSGVYLHLETQILRGAFLLHVPHRQMVAYLLSLPQIESYVFQEVNLFLYFFLRHHLSLQNKKV